MTGEISDHVRNTAQGGIMLLLGQIVSTLISAVAVILVNRMLGVEGAAAVTVVMVPVNVALLFRDLGVSTTVTRFVAKWRQEKREEDISMLFRTALVFNVSIGLVLGSLLWFFADLIAASFLGDLSLSRLIRVASFTVFAEGIANVGQATLVGYERMFFKSLSQIAWSFFRGAISLALVYLGLGPYGSILGDASGVFLSGLVSLVLLLYSVRVQAKASTWFSVPMLRMILTFGYPLFLSALVAGVLGRVLDVLMTMYVAWDVIGNYAAASRFGVLISFITVPLSTVLFPFLSKMEPDNPDLKHVFQSSVRYTSLLTLPIAVGLMVLAVPVIDVIYGDAFPQSPFLLQLFLLVFLWEGLGGLSLGNLIVTSGETRLSFRVNLIRLIIGAPAAYLLIPRYGMVGYLALLSVLPIINQIVFQAWLQKTMPFSVDWVSSLRIYSSCLGASALVLGLNAVFPLHGWIGLLLGGILFYGSYAVLVVALRAVNRRDFELVGGVSSSIPLIGRIMGKLCSYLCSIL